MDKQVDLSKYRSLLCRLASKAGRTDFHDFFKQVLNKAKVPTSLHFVLKMELKRLQKPSQRQIDLRGLVDGDCHPFIFANRTHFLDDIAKAVFQDQYENFGDYTVGVYESVTNTHNNFRVMHANKKTNAEIDTSASESKNSISYDVPVLQLGNSISRKEERMHYVSDVFLVGKEKNVCIGRTVDISASGCQIKTSKKVNLIAGQVLELRFKKLEEEFALGLKKGLDYKVVSTEQGDSKFDVVRLIRQPCQLTKSFDEFLRNYITGNKRRYKINLDNTVHSVMSRGYSQYSMPRRNDLSLLVRRNKQDLEAFMAVATELNKDTIEYWQDARKDLVIADALTPKRLSIIENNLKKGNSTSYLYAFSGVNKQNEKVFYAALKQELEHDVELKKLFWAIGMESYDFKVFQLNLSDASQADAHQPFSLMNDEIELFRKLNKPPSPRVMQKFIGLNYVLSISDISTSVSSKEYITDVKNESLIEKVKLFKVERNRSRKLETVPIKFLDLRKEERYEYNTPVTVRFEKNIYEGQSVDLSTKGLRIRFEEAVDLKVKTELLVELPEFDKEYKEVSLKQLRYKVVSINDSSTEICLTISGNAREHAGRIVIRDIIKKNRNFLMDFQAGVQDLELSWSVQNILSLRNTPFTVYIKRKGRRYVPAVATLGGKGDKFFTFQKRNKFIDLDFIFKTGLYKHFLEAGMGQRHLSNSITKCDILVSIIEDKIDVKLDRDFTSLKDKKQYIDDANKKGHFFCLHGSIAKTGRPDLSRVSGELNYICMYSLHKGKEIEEQLWSICGIMNFTDITDEVIDRLSIT